MPSTWPAPPVSECPFALPREQKHPLSNCDTQVVGSQENRLDPAVVAEAIAAWNSTTPKGNIRNVVEAILTSDSFFDPEGVTRTSSDSPPVSHTGWIFCTGIRQVRADACTRITSSLGTGLGGRSSDGT